MDRDKRLYGERRHKRKMASDEPPTATSSAFKTAMLAAIAGSKASSTSSQTTGGRARPSASLNAPSKKENLFTAPKPHPSKRRRTDEDDGRPAYATSDYHAALSTDEWQRSKRKMEAKARLYAAMQRGDVDDDSQRYAVDFDRKWAERHPADGANPDFSEQDDDGDSSQEGEEELVEYTDELGRTRRGTRAEAAREARRQQTGLVNDTHTARPAMPAGLIYGDTIQTAAFEPDDSTAAQMADLAARRDREPTPPDPTHFDGRAEIRNKGTGFFAFARDEAERLAQMDALAKDRADTERAREQKLADDARRKAERQQLVQDRRRKIKDARDKRQADRFLQTLGREMDVAAAAVDAQEVDDK